MHGNAAAVPAVQPDSRPKRRRRYRPQREPYDKRTRAGKRAAELERHLRAKFGEEACADPVLSANIARAAQLQALSENARAEALRGQGALDAVVRIERVSTLALKRLGLDEREPKKLSRLATLMRGGKP